jgi:membrane fusion protein (multidrug efflux system)
LSKAVGRSLIVLVILLAVGLLVALRPKSANSPTPPAAPAAGAKPQDNKGKEGGQQSLTGGSVPGGANPGRFAGGPGAGAPLPVTARVLQPERIDNSITSTGTIIANEEVEIRSEIQGKISHIAFKEGAKVKKGDLLVRIEDSELQAQLLKARYARKLAEDNEFRMRKQLEIEAVSQKDYDQALNEVNMEKAQEKLLLAQLEKTQLRAPFAGTAGLKLFSEGAYVSPSALITTLQQIDPVKLDFTIPGKYVGRIKAGQTVRFTVQGSGKTLEGRIYAVDPRIDPDNRTLRLRALCPNAGQDVLPGAFAAVEIPLESMDSALMVPSEAMSADARGARVFLFAGGKAEVRPVKAGLRTDSAVQIVSGLKQGDTVITSGIIQMRPGAAVTISGLD